MVLVVTERRLHLSVAHVHVREALVRHLREILAALADVYHQWDQIK